MTPPAPALVERFRRDLETVLGEMPSAARPLGVAVSGGADSLALLLLADAACPGAVAAATVDHGLRPEAAEEAAAVQALSARLGIRHETLRVPPECFAQGNLQERARTARYAALADWAVRIGAPWVAVAQQRDDVAETLLMRLRRGAGLGGLAAMRAVRPIADAPGAPLLIRPLLGWSRRELAAIVRAAGIAPAADPANLHPRFDRSRIRELLAATGELPPERLALAAANLRHAEEAIAWSAEREWQARHRRAEPAALLLDPAGLPQELRRRLVRRAIEAVRRDAGTAGEWRGTGLDRLIAGLEAGEAGTLAGVKAAPAEGEWRFEPAPPRRSH